MDFRHLWHNRPSAVRRRHQRWCAALHAEGLTVTDVNHLARYNTQVSEGVLHSENWTVQMADLQKRYDRAIIAYLNVVENREDRCPAKRSATGMPPT